MAKISNTHHVTKDGTVKRNPGKKKDTSGLYRVYYDIPFGSYMQFEKQDITVHNSRNAAVADLKSRIAEAKMDDSDWEDGSEIIMENVETGDKAGYVFNEDDGWVETMYALSSVK